jgi:hypothetical protein
MPPLKGGIFIFIHFTEQEKLPTFRTIQNLRFYHKTLKFIKTWPEPGKK